MPLMNEAQVIKRERQAHLRIPGVMAAKIDELIGAEATSFSEAIRRLVQDGLERREERQQRFDLQQRAG
jgi:Arc/MetJ-type ribon-helix-helix transcriptional regulator